MEPLGNAISQISKFSEVKKGGIAMLIIDPQNDFHPGGSLAVAHANEDSAIIAKFIHKHMDKISQINITLDSHQRFHIAHSLFWTDAHGKQPEPFTIISAQDIQKGKWIPTRSELKEYALEYALRLEKNGRFMLCIWPEHCITGTPGSNIVDNVHKAAFAWVEKKKERINYVLKGTNCFTEHYSALQADVEIPSDPSTSLNRELIEVLKRADVVVICGEALSHCVNFTTRDLCVHWPADRMSDIHVLVDASSSVGGFEEKGKEFLQWLKTLGVTLCTSDQFVLSKVK